MALARWTAALIDDQGNSYNGTEVDVEVRLEITGQPLTPVPYADDAGATPLGNPFKTSNGEIAMHLVGGRYQIRAFTGPSNDPTFEKFWRYAPIGLAAGTDILGLTPQGDWSSIVTYEIGHFVNHGGLSFASNIATNLDNEPPATAVSDANWTYLPAIKGDPGSALITGTSINSLTISIAQKVFTITEDPPRGWGVSARLRLTSDANPNNWMEGVLSAYNSVTKLATLEVDLLGPQAAAGPFTDWTINLTGEQGPKGTDGTDPGFRWDFDASTNVGADAGLGKWWADNADLSLATHLAFSEVTGEANAAAIESVFQRWAANTNPIKGNLLGKKVGAPEVRVWCEVTALSDQTNYWDLTIQNVVAQGAVSAVDVFSWQFTQYGPPGADGAGSVDTVNSIPSVAGNVPVNSDDIPYDNAGSNLVATNTEAAIDELDGDVATLETGKQDASSGQSTAEALGTVTTGSITPEPSNGETKTLTCGGAFTWNAPTENGGYVCEVLNNASAGTITPVGFDKEEISKHDTVDTNRFEFAVTNIGGYKELTLRARQ